MRTLALHSRRAALLAGAVLCGCAGADQEYRNAVPTNEQVTIAVPAGARSGSGQSLGPLEQALLGQTSEYYQFTLGVSTIVNGSALVLLGLLRAVAEQHPTSSTATTRIWGPYSPGGLDPLTYRVRIEKAGTDEYVFSIDARLRASHDDADFLPLLDGRVRRGPRGGSGSGTMALRFDNARVLQPTQCEVGTITYLFDNTGPEASLEVQFARFSSDNPKGLGCTGEEPRDATYRYRRASDGAGDFVFDIRTNVNRADENKPAFEDVKVRSRWQSAGPGRSDVRIGGGNVAIDLAAAQLGTEVTASQCWDARFATTYETSAPPELKLILTAGEAGACPFSSMQLP